MSEVELRLTADTDSATAGVRGFRKEYADLVKALEKPVRQIDALQRTQESAKGAASEFFAAKRRVDELKTAISAAGQPVASLDRELTRAERTLTRTTQAFERQKQRVKEQRAELKAAGIDTRNLAAEQQRLQTALTAAAGKGRADAAITSAMDTFGVTRLRNLRAQLVSLNSDYKRLTQSGVLSATERASAEIQYQARLAETKRAINDISGEAASGSEGLAAIGTKLAGIVAVAYTVQRSAGAFFGITDAVGELEDRMRNALPVQEEYERAQARLEEISKRVRIPIAQTSELFLRSVGPLQEMGFSARTTADMVASLSAGLVANSVKGQQAEAVINQFTKGLQTGVIRGEAFNAILENSRALTDALTKGLGVTRAELMRMAAAGELTTERVVMALGNQSEALLGLADNMRVTVADAQGTFSDSLGKVIASIDKLLGISEKAVEELDALSAALDSLADGGKDLAPVLAYGETLLKRMGPAGYLLSKSIDQYKKWQEGVADAAEGVTSAQRTAADEAEEIEERRLAEMRAYAGEFNSIQEGLTRSFETALKDQVSAQNKANSKLEAAKKAQLDTEKRYRDAFDKLRSGATGPASYGNAQRLQYAANQALQSGDVERAKKNAQAALEMLMELAEAGENTYGFEGFIKSLQAIEQQADRVAVEKATQARQAEIDKVREFKKEFEELKNFKITPSIDDEALAAATAKMQRWASMIGKDVKIDPRVLSTDSGAASGWHAPMLAPTPGAAKPLPVTVQPVAVAVESAPGEPPVIEAQIKPAGFRKDGPNSFTNLPPVPVDIAPAGIRQDGENSFTNLPAVPVDIAPAGIRQDGESSFTNLPPVDVELALDQESAAATAQMVQALADEFRKHLTVPVTLAGAASAAAPVDGFAYGGYTGHGGKFQPAGIVHAGEHVQPQEVVREPGALHFLERIRRNGFRATLDQIGVRGYANGGLVVPVPRFVPNVPAPSQALLDAAAAPSMPHLGSLDFNLGGESFQVFVNQSQVDPMRLAARKFGRTHK